MVYYCILQEYIIVYYCILLYIIVYYNVYNTKEENYLKKTDEADKKDQYTLHNHILHAFNLLTEGNFIDLIALIVFEMQFVS